LLQHKDQLLAPVAFQTLGYFSAAGLNPGMTQFGKLPRVTFPTDDGRHNQLSRHPTQVADHIGELNIHLRQRFLHSLHTGRRSREVL
jgi:hypothetical protein